ncbi:MAG: 2-C-methyl-D-erythritol 4-phosphate cytidylyltransferase [Candidatus Omnitrophica bacterium]|nr:2-C-methyl-D-erythritol 4-phosphate cytidylyltransferase [Candidatus Omnitrophota bacterium]
MSVVAIVPAAGAGQRFGGRTSKPFALLHNAPLLLHTLIALQASPAIRWIVPAVRASDASRVAALLKRYKITKALSPCRGGSSRAESVARAFAAVPKAARWVLVHDGARPCVSPQLIAQAVQAGKRFGAVACGLPASLTVKAVDDRSTVRLTLDRDQLWFVQTPQVFRRDWFAQALERANHGLDRFPDDAAIVEGAGFPVRMIPGDPLNIKVTTQDDLVLVEAILARGNHRAHAHRHRVRHSSV